MLTKEQNEDLASHYEVMAQIYQDQGNEKMRDLFRRQAEVQRFSFGKKPSCGCRTCGV